MNKKIVGFVLATVLILGLGAVKSFTSEYDSSSFYASANNQSYQWTEETSKSTKNNQDGKTTSTQTGKGFLISFGSAKDRLSGNLSGVYSYYAGTCIGYQQAGGNYVLYDSYGQRATLSNAGGQHFTLQTFNFRTSDLGKMPGDNGTVAHWNKYLKSLGFSGEQLRRMKFDEKGNPKGTKYTYLKITGKPKSISKDAYNSEDKDTDNYYYYTEDGKDDNGKKVTKYYKVKKTDTKKVAKESKADFTDVSPGNVEYQDMSLGLFKMLRDTLIQGINYSASLSAGDGATGMSLAVSEDGKHRATYVSYDNVATKNGNSNPAPVNLFGKSYSGVRCTSETLYNENTGLQIGTKNYTFEFDNTTANSKENKVGVGGTWKASYTFINYDSKGKRYDTTFNKVEISGAKKDTFTWTGKDDNGKNIGNAVTGNINTDRGDKSKATSVTYYSDNGSTSQTVNNETGQKTFYVDNKVSYTLNRENELISKNQYTNNGVLELSWQSTGTQGSNDNKKGGSTTVYDYWGRNVATFNDTDAKYFGSHTRAKNLLNIANTYKKGLISGNTNTLKGKMNNVNWFEEDIKGIGNGNSIINTVFPAYAISTMLNFANGVSAVASTKVADSEWEDNVPSNAIGKDKIKKQAKTTGSGQTTHKTGNKTNAYGYTLTTTIMAGGSSVYETKCNVVTSGSSTDYYRDPELEGDMWSSEPTDKELAAAMKKEGINKKDKKAVAALKEKLSKAKLEAKAKELGIDINDEEAMEDLKNGFYTASDGQTYAIVNVKSIGLQDGKPFHTVDGETMLVAVDKATKNSIIKNMNSTGDRSIMFMGDVRESVNGYLTMTMNTSYGGGYVQGSAAVQNAKKEIAETSMKVASARYAYEHGEMSEKEYNKIVKDAGWIGKNTDANLQKFANGNFSWDNNKSSKQNLRDAWRILLNF